MLAGTCQSVVKPAAVSFCVFLFTTSSEWARRQKYFAPDVPLASQNNALLIHFQGWLFLQVSVLISSQTYLSLPLCFYPVSYFHFLLEQLFTSQSSTEGTGLSVQHPYFQVRELLCDYYYSVCLRLESDMKTKQIFMMSRTETTYLKF